MNRAMQGFAGLALLLGLAASSAFGQGFFSESGPGPQVRPGEEVVVSFESSATVVRPGETITIAFIMNHAPSWHSWPSAAQDVLPPEIADFALRTEAGLDGVQPSWISHVGPVQWPEPHDAPVANPMGGAPISVPTYSGRAIAYLPVIVSDDAEPGDVSLDVRVFFQACDDSVCVMPRTETDTLALTIVERDAPIEATTPDPNIFGDFDPSVFAQMRSGEIATIDSAASTPDQGESIAPATTGRTFFGISVPQGDGVVGIVILALLSALGGFILNLTPCVLPVIPLKIMAISHHAGSPGRSLYLGLWMAAGVIGFWLGIGLPVAFLTSVTDPSRLFGIWWVTLGIGVLIAMMGVGIMGLFAINLPQQVYMVNPKADSAPGSFAFGVMTAVLGLPCFGFVAGALLAGAATLPTSVILIIFGSLGVGMAAPYLVLSAKPGLVEKLPRTGPASELVKQVMGLLLLAAAAYFIGSGLIALVSERPWMARQLHWWAVALFGAAAGVWLLVRTVQITSKAAPRFVFTIVAVVIGAVGVLYAMDSTAKARENYQDRAAAIAAAGGEGQLITTTWIDYSPELLERARSEGYIVVLDFTAEWCLNCKALKAAVLNREPVKSALASDRIISMTVDLTSTKAPGWEKLRELGQTGIPLLVVYGPGLDEPWQSNAYTAQQVMDALEAARDDSNVPES